ncbi:MAG: hypothetical protein NTX50_17875 [Candidatus Sumerlaeota bacterium]|nr:hypothetical protein [Candidatus Sumerlaeota bacterium]
MRNRYWLIISISMVLTGAIYVLIRIGLQPHQPDVSSKESSKAPINITAMPRGITIKSPATTPRQENTHSDDVAVNAKEEMQPKTEAIYEPYPKSFPEAFMPYYSSLVNLDEKMSRYSVRFRVTIHPPLRFYRKKDKDFDEHQKSETIYNDRTMVVEGCSNGTNTYRMVEIRSLNNNEILQKTKELITSDKFYHFDISRDFGNIKARSQYDILAIPYSYFSSLTRLSIGTDSFRQWFQNLRFCMSASAAIEDDKLNGTLCKRIKIERNYGREGKKNVIIWLSLEHNNFPLRIDNFNANNALIWRTETKDLRKVYEGLYIPNKIVGVQFIQIGSTDYDESRVEVILEDYSETCDEKKFIPDMRCVSKVIDEHLGIGIDMQKEEQIK